jgi:hypothetical protein
MANSNAVHSVCRGGDPVLKLFDIAAWTVILFLRVALSGRTGKPKAELAVDV